MAVPFFFIYASALRKKCYNDFTSKNKEYFYEEKTIIFSVFAVR